MYIEITDHVAQAQDRLVQQYKESTNLNNFIKSIVDPIQILENETFNVYINRSINTAVGYQLDGIGKIVGIERGDLNDVNYRAAIVAQIEINISGGEPESIINAMRALFNPLVIDYVDIYPAYFQLYLQAHSFIHNLPVLISSFSPVGIGAAILLQGSVEGNPFVFNETSVLLAGFLLQSGDFHGQEVTELELVFSEGANYTLEIIKEENTEDLTGDGFAEVYLNDANYDIGDGTLLEIGDGTLLELEVFNSQEDYHISTYGGELVEVII
jgi:Protein of unknown function (DUF2612)